MRCRQTVKHHAVPATTEHRIEEIQLGAGKRREYGLGRHSKEKNIQGSLDLVGRAGLFTQMLQ
jgi:hypothetical protein